MEENRKGLCTNFDKPCTKAVSKQIIEVPLTADFICPECESDLFEIKDKRRISTKKIGLIALLFVVLGSLTWGIIVIFSGHNTQQQSNKTDLLSRISDNKSTNAPEMNKNQPETNGMVPKKNEAETSKSNDSKAKNEDLLTANSIEEYFSKIADNSIEYSKKDNLKREIIRKYFADGNSLIVEIGANNTEVNHTEIKDYVEVLSQQYYKIKIIKKEVNSNQKITKLFIKEI